MTIRTLIELLELYDKNTRVIIEDGNGFGHNIKNVVENVSEHSGQRIATIEMEFGRTADFT